MNQSRQQRRSGKNPISLLPKKDWSIATMKSEPLEQKSPNFDPTPTQNLPTPNTNTGSMQHPITSTNGSRSREANTQANLSPLTNPDTQKEQTNLPPPFIPISEKSGDEQKKPPRKQVTKQAEFIDPLALSPAHERKAQQLAQTYAQLGIVTMGFNPTAGKIIYITAVDRAREVLRVARHHPAMMKIVDNIISGNDYVTLILGHVSMVGSILAVQDKLPETPMTVGLKMQGFQSLMAWDAMQTMIAGTNGSNLDATKQYTSASA